MAETIRSSEAYSPIGGNVLEALARVSAMLIKLAEAYDEERRRQRLSSGESTAIDSVAIAMALLRLNSAVTDLHASARVAEIAALKILTDQELPSGLREAVASIIDAGIVIRDEYGNATNDALANRVGVNVPQAHIDPPYNPSQGQTLSAYQLNT